MNIIDFAGRFHPLVVHLPIGVISIFLVLLIAISREKLRKSEGIIRLILLVAAIASTFSSITGYLISIDGSYDNDLVLGHQILGITLTIVCWITYFGIHYLLESKNLVYNVVIGISSLLMILTGHAGGSLTHGSDFLSPPPVDQWFLSSNETTRSFSMDSKAIDVVSAIFEKKCYSCHGKSKQKGKLRLDTHEGIKKGGEEGSLISHDANSSLLIQRLLLPKDDEEHMPPKEKKQLTEQEISFLMWWIDSGADFDVKLNQLSFPDSLSSLLSNNKTKAINVLVPVNAVKEADGQAIAILQALDVVIEPIGSNSNYLAANFVNMLPGNVDNAVLQLEKVKDQLIWLNLDYQQLNLESWEFIGNLKNLRKISVKNTNLNDASIKGIGQLQNLVVLNLVSTQVTMDGLKSLNQLEKLRSLFLYQTPVENNDYHLIQTLFPGVVIDTGNYVVPTLDSDTTVFKKEDL